MSFITLPNIFNKQNDCIIEHAKSFSEVMQKFRIPIEKYSLLMQLFITNRQLFFKYAIDNLEEIMPFVYTPTVGEACLNLTSYFPTPRGLYITYNSNTSIEDSLKTWPDQDIKVIVVTDGERILGLGDLGAYGMGIPIGKLCLYTALGGVAPQYCLPITLDVGTNNETLLKDPLYNGVKSKRIAENEYNAFVDKFMKACVNQFGTHVLIQFEDFGNKNAFALLHRYRDSYCTFNDDIQGTAAVTLASLLTSFNKVIPDIADCRILFYGAGEAAIGCAQLLVTAFQSRYQLSEIEARRRIFLFDSRGLVVSSRPANQLTEEKRHFAQPLEPTGSLLAAVELVKPAVLVGLAAQPGAFDQAVLESMARLNRQPVILSLSNPTNKAECTARQAYECTEGRCIFSSGSPFDAVQLQCGRSVHPSQCNNSYIFPAFGLACVAAAPRCIPDELFLVAATRLADLVTNEELAEGRTLPAPGRIRAVEVAIAAAVISRCVELGINRLEVPADPERLEDHLRSVVYMPAY